MLLKVTGRPAAAKSRRIVYQVRSGDSLWVIAQRFDLAVKQIRNWNNLGENHVLRPGQKLTLQVTGERRG
jgi:membrane-bound lytic murein transglycosylase D